MMEKIIKAVEETFAKDSKKHKGDSQTEITTWSCTDHYYFYTKRNKEIGTKKDQEDVERMFNCLYNEKLDEEYREI